MESIALDAAGHRPSPPTMPGDHPRPCAPQQGHALPGRPADHRGDRRRDARARREADGLRLRALNVLLWRAGLRWLDLRRSLPVGSLVCVIHGPTAGRRWEASAARKQLPPRDR
jgi:hypothetical protein